MGKFVCLEGIDGSGKTTLTTMVAERLCKAGFSCCCISKKSTEFGSPYISNIMRNFKKILWNEGVGNPVYEVTDHGWLFFHAAWYTIMSQNLIPELLAEFDYVIIDGWFYKIMCRFMAKEEFDKELLEKVFCHLPKGDIVIMLDVQPDICYQRKQCFNDAEIGENEHFEGTVKERFVNYQNNVREQYLSVAKNNHWHVVVPVDNAPEFTVSQIVDMVLRH